MSLDALTWAFSQDLEPAKKVVLLALADYADDRGRCWPSQETMTAKTSLSVRSIRTQLRALEAHGLIVTTQRKRPDGGRSSNEYVLPVTPRQNLPGPPAATRRGPRQTAAGAPRHAAAEQEPSLEPPENHPPTPDGESSDGETSRWAREECDARRPRGQHDLDADGLMCVHCGTRDPDVTAVERDAIVARRKLTALQRDHAPSIPVDELLGHADRFGDGDLLAGARIVRQIIEEPMPVRTRDPAKLLRSRLRTTRARRVQAA